MADRKDNPELMADLLGYHLGLADEETRARVEREFSAQELAAARDTASKVLSPLDSDSPMQPPPKLVDNIMARVDALNATFPLKRPAVRMTPEHGRGGAGRPLMRMRELVGLAAAIALFLGVFMPGYRNARLAQQQGTCLDNLRQMGNAYGAYAAMFEDQTPFASGPLPPNASWRRVANSGLPVAPNSRHSWLLVVGKLVPPNATVCPGRENDRPLTVDAVRGLEGFPDPRNNSYATNLVTKPQRRADLDSNSPLMGDMNPLAEMQTFPVDASQLPPNSRSHGGTRGGQNVLYADFSARFVRNPNVGIENDDIYRLIGVQEYTGRERPTLRSDAFLVP
ncbi:MAG TPA: hypothetical protein VMV94_19675 [Phycisphaerae bacterium]|nr:hypothetical protein [Phycisphaerae bacterium]